MQIVINLTDEMYQAVKDGMWCGNELWYNALKNGTPLPEGHGRLIDGDELEQWVIEKYSDGEQLAIDISDAPTVIEADKEEKE